MASLNSSCSTVLDLPPCCVEFHTVHSFYAFVGTYFLERDDSPQDQEHGSVEATTEQPQSAQKRSGSIVVLDVSNSARSLESSAGQTLQSLQSDPLRTVCCFPTDYGILDLRFSPHNPDIFCTGNSTNSISIFSTVIQSTTVAPEAQEVSIELLSFVEDFPVGTLVLALQWHPTDSQMIGVSLSDGQVVLCKLSDNYGKTSSVATLSSMHTVLTHDLEAWTLSFTIPSAGDGPGLFSGGDDAALRFTPSSHIAVDNDNLNPVSWKDSRTHFAGVTAILSISSDIILTGSYDDNIRILQISSPPPFRPRVLAEENLGGGVWRLKLIPFNSQLLPQSDQGQSRKATDEVDILVLASCMYAGVRILRITNPAGSSYDDWSIKVIASMEEHKSMNYGSDALLRSKEDDDDIWILSTSFYDKLVCLTQIPQSLLQDSREHIA
jgi:diphthine methyl ester acylhydrolase